MCPTSSCIAFYWMLLPQCCFQAISIHLPLTLRNGNNTLQQFEFIQYVEDGDFKATDIFAHIFVPVLFVSSYNQYNGQFIAFLSLFLCVLYIFSYLRLLGKVNFAIKYYNHHSSPSLFCECIFIFGLLKICI